MNELLKLVVSLSLSGALIALLLFACKPVYRDRLSKRWQYYVWLVVVVRMMLPFAPETNLVNAVMDRVAQSPVSAVTEEAVASQTTVIINSNQYAAKRAEENAVVEAMLPAAAQSSPVTTASTGSAPSLTPLIDSLWLVWFIVALMLFVRKVTSYHSFVRFIKAGRIRVEEEETLAVYQQVCDEMKVRHALPLYQNKLASSPMLVGILKPFIVLPELEVSPDELALVLRHELVHHRRRDILYKWLLQAAVCVHWFNPVVYLISKEVNRNCELSCDEAVIAGMEQEHQRQYGDTLLATLKTGGTYSDAVASVTLSEDGKQLKERLAAILKFTPGSRKTRIAAVAMTLALLCGAAYAGAYVGITKAYGSDGTAVAGGTPVLLSDNAYIYVAQATSGKSAEAVFQNPRAHTVLYFDQQGEGEFSIQVRNNRNGRTVLSSSGMRFDAGGDPVQVFGTGSGTYTLELEIPQDGPDKVTVYGAGINSAGAYSSLSIPDLMALPATITKSVTENIVGNVVGNVVGDVVGSIVGGGWGDQWSKQWEKEWNKWEDEWDQWADAWEDTWPDYSGSTSYNGGGDSWRNLHYTYQNGYLVGAGVENYNRLDDYSVTTSVAVGNETYTVAFGRRTEDYANNSTVKTMVQNIITEILGSDNYRTVRPSYFVVRDVYYDTSAASMTQTVYDDDNWIAFAEIIKHCATQTQMDWLEQCLQDGRDLYFLSTAEELPDDFDALDIGRRAADSGSVIMVSALDRFLDDDTMEELMFQCLGIERPDPAKYWPKK